jgi:uncharacterized protein (TIGR03437 family)
MAFHRRILLVAAVGFSWSAIAQTQTDLFDVTVLHEVRITMLPSDWQGIQAHYLDDTLFPVTTFTWKGGGNLTASVSNLMMHNRGHGSRSPIKPGLHISFDNPTKTQTFLGLTTLELKPNTQDPSLIHESVTMQLFSRMGVPAPREVHSTVYVNDQYIGVYNLVEYIDGDFTQRVWGENNGYLYNYVPGDWAGIPGGGYHFEYLGSNLDLYSSGTVSTPFSPSNHSNAPDTVTLEGMICRINGASNCPSQSSDADFVAAMSPYLDLKGWLKHVAVETYVADFDCILGDVFGMNNFQMYRFQNQQLSIFIAWDKDNAFDYYGRPVLQNANQNVLMRRLMAIPEYRNSYFDSIAKAAILAGGAGGWMETEARREYKQIQQAAYLDPNKLYLNAGVLVPSSNDMFDAAAAAVFAFPAQRSAFVFTDMANQGYTPSSSAPVVSNGGFVSVGSHTLPVAAGGAAEVYGANFGSSNTTSIYINGFLAPLLYTSGGQVDVEVPWEAAGAGTIGAIVNGSPSALLPATVSTYAPVILAITHVDGSYVSAGSPATANETLVVYATGLGPVTGPMVDGQVSLASPLQSTTLTPTVNIGSASGQVSFSGLTPGYLCLYQVNVQVPPNAPANTSLTISIGGQTSPAMALQVH